ncbi:MAG TPA: signal peptidase II [Candidatus Limnocylindrales bacterium]|nr:signal peptidase II [Candidatus Limnocylindrales bacterium]
MSGPGTTSEAVADERPDDVEDVEIVDDEADRTAATGVGGATTAADTWRGPSIGRWIAFAAIAVGVLVVDQLSKQWLVSQLPDAGDALVVIDDLLNFVHGRNDGALFGLLPQSALAFAIVSLIVVVLIVVYHRAAGRGYLTTVALGLLLGGAIGNLLDRVRLGYVVDWIDMGIGSWRFFTYNIADASITIAILLLIGMALVPRLAEWGADG